MNDEKVEVNNFIWLSDFSTSDFLLFCSGKLDLYALTWLMLSCSICMQGTIWVGLHLWVCDKSERNLCHVYHVLPEVFAAVECRTLEIFLMYF